MSSITALSKHIINENNINCKVKWDKLENTVAGQYSDSVVTFNKDKVRGLMSYDIDIINTMFHEITHAIQELKLNDDFMEEIIQGKDTAIYMNSKNITKNINYNLVSYETDARLKAYINTIKYLEEIAPEEAENYKELNRPQMKEEEANLEIYERMLYNEVSDVHEAFDHCLPKYKRMVIKLYPKLLLEYNEDGTRKNIDEMIEELNRQKEYYKEATTRTDKTLRKQYINTIEALLKHRKTTTLQSIKDYQAMKKMVKEEKIKENPITFHDIKKSFDRETVIIKSKVSSMIHPNTIKEIKLKSTKKIKHIYNEIKSR